MVILSGFVSLAPSMHHCRMSPANWEGCRLESQRKQDGKVSPRVPGEVATFTGNPSLPDLLPLKCSFSFEPAECMKTGCPF